MVAAVAVAVVVVLEPPRLVLISEFLVTLKVLDRKWEVVVDESDDASWGSKAAWNFFSFFFKWVFQ